MMNARRPPKQPPRARRTGPRGGRVAADGMVGLTQVNVSLDAETIRIARAIGDGNLSLGLRRIVRSMTDDDDEEDPT